MAVAAVALAGCGDDVVRGGKAKTRPVELFATPPSGYRYAPADAATRKEIRGLITKEAPLEGDDLALRQVLPERGRKRPVAIAIVMDAHASGDPDDAFNGFDARVKEMGASAERATVAGATAGFARVDGVEAGLAGKNGYVLESIATERRTARLVLARLIFAAGAAER